MSHGLLEILRYFLLAVIWLFFVYAARMVFVEVKRGRVERPAVAAGVEPPPNQRPGAKRQQLRLKVVEPEEMKGRTFDVGREVTIGRSPGCAIPLENDTFASSVHARVFDHAGALWVEDLGSTNGTYRNGERLLAPTRLRRGDRVKVGKTSLEVSR